MLNARPECFSSAWSNFDYGEFSDSYGRYFARRLILETSVHIHLRCQRITYKLEFANGLNFL